MLGLQDWCFSSFWYTDETLEFAENSHDSSTTQQASVSQVDIHDSSCARHIGEWCKWQEGGNLEGFYTYRDAWSCCLASFNTRSRTREFKALEAHLPGVYILNASSTSSDLSSSSSPSSVKSRSSRLP